MNSEQQIVASIIARHYRFHDYVLLVYVRNVLRNVIVKLSYGELNVEWYRSVLLVGVAHSGVSGVDSSFLGRGPRPAGGRPGRIPTRAPAPAPGAWGWGWGGAVDATLPSECHPLASSRTPGSLPARLLLLYCTLILNVDPL